MCTRLSAAAAAASVCSAPAAEAGSCEGKKCLGGGGSAQGGSCRRCATCCAVLRCGLKPDRCQLTSSACRSSSVQLETWERGARAEERRRAHRFALAAELSSVKSSWSR